MSLKLPSRQLLKSASTLSSSVTSPSANALLPALQSLSLAAAVPSQQQQCRSIHTTNPNQWNWFGFGKKKEKKQSPDGLEKQMTGTRKSRQELMQRLQKPQEGPQIFDDDVPSTPAPAGSEYQQPKKRSTIPRTRAGGSLDPEHLNRALVPDPLNNARWHRKMVIRAVRRGTDPFSKETRAELIARTEREHLSKSPFLATSVKKLVHLARQIQGKNLTEAIHQMRFSKKKAAREVLVQLQLARDTAIVQNGMGLGGGSSIQSATAKEGDELVPSGKKGGVKIQTKDGKFIEITDPTQMYVAEAWVNRGPWRGIAIDYRARGNSSRLMKPSTSIYIVLKEEKTRIREHEERVARKLRQGPWVHLPDRPVTAQRPYYSW